MKLTQETIDNWMRDYSVFKKDFEARASLNLKIMAVTPIFDYAELQRGHTQWASDCEYFRVHKFQHEADELSYIKIMALFASCMSNTTYFDRLLTCNTPNADQKALQTDLMGAPEIVAAVDFSFDCLDALEALKKRNLPFVDRITPDFRHDLIHYIKTEQEDKAGVILAYKGIYARF